MAKETIGVVMANWESFVDRKEGAPLTGLGYMPVEQMPSGKVLVLSAGVAKEYREMGFKAVAAVVSEVTRHGTKVTHSGYDLHFLESTPPSMRETLKHLSPVIVDGLIEEFYDSLGAKKQPLSRPPTLKEEKSQ